MGNTSPISCALPLQWESIKEANGTAIPAREGHGGVQLDGKLYLFGGIQDCDNQSMEEDDEEEFPTACMNDVYCFDIKKNEWKKLECTGEIPSPRSGFVTLLVDQQMFIYGGLDPLYGWMNDGFLLDLATAQWTKINFSGDAPSPRDKMCADLLPDGRIVMFGGFGPQTPELEEGEEVTATFGWFNDTFLLEPAHSYRWTRLATQGEHPTPRAAAGMAIIQRPSQVKVEKEAPTTEGTEAGSAQSNQPEYREEGDAQPYMYIMGGRDNRGSRANDCFSLEISSLTWNKQTFRGTAPIGRSFHTVVGVEDKLVVFGGANPAHQVLNDIHILDTRAESQHAWVQPELPEQTVDIPSGRAFHAAVLVPIEDTLFLYVHGGTGQMDIESGEHLTFCHDLWRLNLSSIAPFRAPTVEQVRQAAEAKTNSSDQSQEQEKKE